MSNLTEAELRRFGATYLYDAQRYTKAVVTPEMKEVYLQAIKLMCAETFDSDSLWNVRKVLIMAGWSTHPQWLADAVLDLAQAIQDGDRDFGPQPCEDE